MDLHPLTTACWGTETDRQTGVVSGGGGVCDLSLKCLLYVIMCFQQNPILQEKS